MKRYPAAVVIAISLASCSSVELATAAPGDLEITEIMYNTVGGDDLAWEWIEVRNTTAAPIDLNGAWLDRLGASEPAPGELPSIANTNVPPGSSITTVDTVVPGFGLAVLINASFGDSDVRTFNTEAFKSAWNLTSELVIPVRDMPALPNSGENTNIAIWENETVYRGAFQENGEGNKVIMDFATALAGADYDVVDPWPTSSNGFSIEYLGSGSANNGTNWLRSELGSRGASESVQVLIDIPGGGPGINDTRDVANPGVFHGSAPTTDGSLLITEVMFDPASEEADWEWIEVYNNTGNLIDFGANPGVLDDGNNTLVSAPNLTSGTIPDGTVAVLYDSGGLDVAEISAAWQRGSGDPDFGTTINFIPVSNWQSLNNSAGGADDPSTAGTGALDGYRDIISIWASQSDYDTVLGNPIDPSANPMAVLRFTEGQLADDQWPGVNQGPSIYLTDLTSTAGNGFYADGDLWAASDDDSLHSYHAKPVGVTNLLEVHPGGDVASPGVFLSMPAEGLPGDFNGDSVVNLADYAVWRDNLGSTAAGILHNNGDEAGVSGGVVDVADYTLWKENYGNTLSSASVASSVPEPTAWATLLLALATANMAGRLVKR